METSTVLSQVKQDALTDLLLSGFKQPGLVKILEWKNNHTQRYYFVFAGTDLLGDRILERRWGSLSTRRAGQLITIHQENEMAGIVSTLRALLKTRARNGYKLITDLGLGLDEINA
ncbi:hypothetical protein [Thiomicrorhabdus aquaedulcis]|uniref:hypothetical protein n=1 Tax=Thiomicrorhabdus aquaedulcis TaxID=2211106 RepID=UPI000FD99105|nr:hypothetical protein [Thiomicrorhabdus aquaedulcis]